MHSFREGVSQNETGLFSLLLVYMQWFMTLTMKSRIVQRLFGGSGALFLIPLCELKFLLRGAELKLVEWLSGRDSCPYRHRSKKQTGTVYIVSDKFLVRFSAFILEKGDNGQEIRCYLFT